MEVSNKNQIWQRKYYIKHKNDIALRAHIKCMEKRKNGMLLCKICSNPILNLSFRRYCSKNCAKEGQRLAGLRSKNKWYNSFHGRYSLYKRNAKRLNRDFTITLDEFKEIVVKPCIYCGKIPEKISGIDRIDNNKGYIKSNCAPCCKTCNRMKFDYSKKEFIEHCRIIAEYGW